MKNGEERAYNIRLRAGGSHASRRSTLSGHAALSVTRLTPRPKPEAPAGPRGVRAAPPPLPPGARYGAGLPCLAATGAGRLANQSTSAARRVPLRLRLASGFGPRRASPRKGGRRGVGRVSERRQSRSGRLVVSRKQYWSMGAPSHAARPRHFRVVDGALHAGPHRPIALRRDGCAALRVALAGTTLLAPSHY